MKPLPPLDCLRFFEAAARHQSFALAAGELGVTPAAVGHRIRMLEAHLQAALFIHRHRGVRLNRRGRTYNEEVQRILAEVHSVSERQRHTPRRMRMMCLPQSVCERRPAPSPRGRPRDAPVTANLSLSTAHRRGAAEG